MHESNAAPNSIGNSSERDPAESSAPIPLSHDEETLEALREILLGHYRQRMVDLQAELDELQKVVAALDLQIHDKSALIDTITPIIADSLRTSIHEARGDMVDALHPIIAETIRTNVSESREQMIEALYPITGELVQRSVTEAMREFARRIDQQMRTTFSVQSMIQRVQAQMQGVSEAELAMRRSLPFQVERLFFVHRESGILLHHLLPADEAHPTALAATSVDDSDLISGMLTAIQDFVQDALGRGEEGQLDAIQYGNQQILIETARYTYIAIVVRGIEPSGLRAAMRSCAYEIERDHAAALRAFDGDLAPLQPAGARLRTLIPAAAGTDADATHAPAINFAEKRVQLAILGIVIIGIVLAIFFVWQG